MLSAAELSRSHAYMDGAFETHEYLNTLSTNEDFTPKNDELNSRLSRFVCATMEPRPEIAEELILGASSVREIVSPMRDRLARAETGMEHYCANAMLGRIPNAPRGYSSFWDFLYLRNYEELMRIELNGLNWQNKCPPLDKDTESVAFVGCGPCPYSAILFHLKTGFPITCIDRDPVACELARDLISYLSKYDERCTGIDKHVHVVCGDGAKYDFATHPVIFIAAMIMSADEIIMQFLKSSHTAARLVSRTAQGMAEMLYAPRDVVAGLEEYNMYLLTRTRPGVDYDRFINACLQSNNFGFAADAITGTPFPDQIRVGITEFCSEAINCSFIYTFPPGKQWRRQTPDFVMSDVLHMDVVRPTPPRFARYDVNRPI